MELSLDPSAATVSKMSLHGGSCCTGFATRPGIWDVQFSRISFCLQEERLIDKSAKERRRSISDPLVQQPLNSQANTGVLLSLRAGFKWVIVKAKSPNSGEMGLSKLCTNS